MGSKASSHDHDHDHCDNHGHDHNHGDYDDHGDDDGHHSHDHGNDHSHDRDDGCDHGDRHTARVVEVNPAAGATARNSGSPRSAANTAERKAYGRKLKRAITFVFLFFVVEMIGGFWSGSLAIMSDAAHLLSDVIGFVLAIVANEIAGHPPSESLTYGPVRWEVLSALFSTMFILALSVLLVYSAFCRLYDMWRGEAEQIDGQLMSFIALLGLLVNLALLGIFTHDEDLGHDHGHGHNCGHAHGHGHGNHVDDHSLNNNDEEQALVANCNRAGGATAAVSNATDMNRERAPLVDNSFFNFSFGLSGVAGGKSLNTPDSVSSADSAPSLTEQYGSIAELTKGESVPQNSSNQKERKRNLNMEAAILHALTDLVQSLGVLFAGLLIWYDPRWQWADPISTLFFVGLVVKQTRWLLTKVFNVLLEGVPETISYERLKNRLVGIPGVTDVHSLHIWSLTMGKAVVSVHMKATDPERVISEAQKVCEDMGVEHSTIQVQLDSCAPLTS